jgi:predicted HicB family RNase H-like nuclease
MAIKTITAKAGGGVDYSPGWKKLKISNAKYGTFNSKKYLDIWFDGYSENLNARVYETLNKKTGEEFKISNWFKFSNSGVQEVIDNDSGNIIITYDDEDSNLIGNYINVLFYKDGEYSRVWREPAPVVLESSDGISYTESDVSYWKNRSERSMASFIEMSTNSGGEPLGRTLSESVGDIKDSDIDDPPF